MRPNITLITALAGACLSAGCVVEPLPPPPNGPIYRGGYVEAAPYPPDEIFVPEIVIIERGIRHDRYFYQRHPEIYRRDRMMYPDRFRMPPPHHRGDFRPDHRPDYHHPNFQRPEVQRPGNQRPEFQRPGNQQPEFQRPGGQRPEFQRPGGQRPEFQRPGGQQPGAQRPGAQQPTNNQQPVDHRKDDPRKKKPLPGQPDGQVHP